MTKEVGAFGWREARDKVTERVPESVDGSQSPGAQHGFEFGENLLDRVEVGTVRRQVEQLEPYRLSRRLFGLSQAAKAISWRWAA